MKDIIFMCICTWSCNMNFHSHWMKTVLSNVLVSLGPGGSEISLACLANHGLDNNTVIDRTNLRNPPFTPPLFMVILPPSRPFSFSLWLSSLPLLPIHYTGLQTPPSFHTRAVSIYSLQ